MSCFDTFLDSMYGKEVSRKRTTSNVEHSVCLLIQTPREKRARTSEHKFKKSMTMSLEDFVEGMYTGRDMTVMPSKTVKVTSSISNEAEALKLALQLLMSLQAATPTLTNESKSSPSPSYSSLPSSVNPSPTGPRKQRPLQYRPSTPTLEPRRFIPLLYVTDPEENRSWVEEG
ncbi:hypothetical protein DFH28DRAFT_608499 [Melampsora americana]|nr:hypothetical protein DFH28DRAFT_608499 [Melampsora americana]